MSANQWSNDYGNEPTTVLPAYRTLPMGSCGEMLIHITPTGNHTVEMDCEGQCLTCNQPLESWS